MTRRKPKSVLLLCQHFYPEMIATGMHMTELAESLVERGWEVHVIAAQPRLSLDAERTRVPELLEYRGIHIHRVKAVGSHFRGLTSRAVISLTFTLTALIRSVALRRHYAGVLVTTTPPFLGMIGWFLHTFLRVPYTLVVYDVYPEIVESMGVLRPGSFLARVWRRASRLSLEGAASIVVIGRDMAEIISRQVAPPHRSRIRLIHNWSDARTVMPVPHAANTFRREHVAEGEFLVQFAGRVGLTHNLEPLIDAAEMLRDEGVVVQLVGEGAKKQRLLEHVAKRRLTNVRFIGYQPIERLGEVLSAADLSVVCLDRRFTGFSVPSKTYGVMAAGVPILGLVDGASEIGETITRFGCGVVVDDLSGESVAAVIRRLRDDEPTRRAMGERGRQAFLEHYTLSRSAERYDECLTEAFAVSDEVRRPFP